MIFEPSPPLLLSAHDTGLAMFTTGRQYTEHPVTHTIFTAATAVLTPWRRVLLEKQTNSQLFKKFLTYYGTQMFIITFTRACHLSLSQVRSINSMPTPPTSNILKTHISIALSPMHRPSKWSQFLKFTTKSLYAPPLFTIHATCPAISKTCG
jgi:hypothetical protein